jgi:hypothetical protein
MDIAIIFIIIFLFYISFFLGKIYGVYLAGRHIKSLLNNSEIKHVNIIVSKSNDSYLVHGAETNEFIAQGKSKREILEILAIRFPLVNFMVDKSNLREVGFIE